MIVLSGSSNQPLAASIAATLNARLGAVELGTFKNGERRVRITDELRGEQVVLVQSFSDPVDTHIVEFLLLADALERLGASQVLAVIPWMGYSLQDKVFEDGESIAARVVARLIANSFIQRVFLLDLHNASVAGFYATPTTHLYPDTLFSEYFADHYDGDDSMVIVSPDFGGMKRARFFSERIGRPFASIAKRRNLKTGEVTVDNLSDDTQIQGATAVLYDDCIVSGGTAVETAKLLKANGAQKVIFCATHGVFVEEAKENLEHPALDAVIITNSINSPLQLDKLVRLDCAPLFTEHIKNWEGKV